MGTINGRYILEQQLGVGGMGEVHLAYDRLTETTVALKRVLAHPGLLTFNSKSDGNLRIALAREFKVLASLRHPNIVSVLDYGFDEQGIPFFTMEYLTQAKGILQSGRTADHATKISFLIQILQGLAYLHRHGLIHRDLKPPNIRLTDGHVRIIDFGLAMLPSQAHNVAGSLLYIAPEQYEGQPASIAADLYAVGLLGYQLFTGQFPFDTSQSVTKLIEDIVTESIDCSELPANIAPIIQRLLHKNPLKRYASAFEVMQALNSALPQAIPLDTPAIRESYLQAAKFVGRDTELQQLVDSLALTSDPKGSLWLIGGESGVGKSRLVDELRTKALVDGVTVLTGQGIEGGGLPYQLWRDVLRHLIIQTEISQIQASVLKELVPNIESLLGYEVPDAPELQGKGHVQRLNRTIVEVFKGQTRPVLLILEDLQWTVESRLPLTYLYQQIAEMSLMVVATYRDDEAPHLPAELAHTHQLNLARLDEQAIATLTQSIIGQSTSNPQLISLIQTQTEGNVFFVVEVVRALAEEAGNLTDVGKVTLPEQVFAGGMQTIIRRRLTRVPVWGQELLDYAAVIGRQVNLDILGEIAPHILDEYSLEAWLQACNEVAVLEVNETQWRFNHDKLREAVLADIDSTQRRILHEKVATIIETIYNADLLPYAESLVRHWRMAQKPLKELNALLMAAEPIMTITQNFVQGAALLERAQYLVEHHETDEVTQLRLYWLLSHGVHLPEAERMAYAEKGYALAQKYQRPAWQHQIGLRMVLNMYDADKIESILFPARDYYLAQQDKTQYIDTQLRLLDAEIRRENFAKVKQQGQKLLNEARALGSFSLEISALFKLSRVANAEGTYEHTITFNEHIYEISQDRGDLSGMASALINIGIAHKNLGDGLTSLAKTYRALDLFAQVNNIRGQGIAYVNLAGAYLEQKDWQQTEAILLEAIHFARERGLRETLIAEYLHRVLIVWRETDRETDAARLLGHFLHSEMEQKYYPKDVQDLKTSLAHMPSTVINQGAGLSQLTMMDWILGKSDPFADDKSALIS